jgi:hypothetical protein
VRLHRQTPPTDPIAFCYKAQNLGKTIRADRANDLVLEIPIATEASSERRSEMRAGIEARGLQRRRGHRALIER